MSTYSEVKAALDDISKTITQSKREVDTAIVRLNKAHSDLDSLPAKYVNEIATIDTYVGTDGAESLAQSEKAKLVPEFLALKTQISGYLTELGG